MFLCLCSAIQEFLRPSVEIPLMARAIQSFHAIYDEDAFFTVTTNQIDNSSLSEISLGAIASELAWDAMLSCFQNVRARKLK